MTTKELESYLQRVADSIELGAELQRTKGELTAIKSENEYLRSLVAQNLKQPDVIGSCQHLWVKDNSKTSIREYCQLCGTPKYVGNLL